MKRLIISLTFLASLFILAIFSTDSSFTIQAQKYQKGSSGYSSNILYVEIPATLKSENLKTPDKITRTNLNELTKRKLETSFGDIKDSLIDALIFFTDLKGKPILPDLERSLSLLPLQKNLGEISFTFNSPEQPWTE